MNNERLRLTLIGYGSVGRPLAQALVRAGEQVVSVGEHEDSERVRTAQQEGFSVFPASLVQVDVDMIALTVGDPDIEDVAREVAGNLEEARKRDPEAPFGRTQGGEVRPAPVVMHTSGRKGLAVLDPLARLGCPRLAWHPIQTFPAEAGPERFAEITVGITGDPAGLEMGKRIATLLELNILEVPEELRVRYHLASVIASNFLPMLLEMGAQRFSGIAGSLEEAWHALLPLVRGMIDSMEEFGPAGAMTGPVARDDLDAALSHLESLSSPDEAELYRSMTRALVSLAMRSGRMERERARHWLMALEPQSGQN